MIRQGDILLIAVDSVPDEAQSVPRVNGRVVVAEGEATGHTHHIETVDVELRELDEIRWLVAPDDFVLDHQEHAPLTVPAGNWRVIHQREYTPEAPRQVTD